jgi:dihydrofolate reductase
MAQLRVHVAMSLDGFMAGPGQAVDEPLGVGGPLLHEWVFTTRYGRAMIGEPGGSEGLDDARVSAAAANVGATIMGRNMFGPVRGLWPAETWNGWWGPNPPYHHDVFVLTHHPRPPLEMEGGTTFHFVTRFDEAMERALEAAGDDAVTIAGGASAVRQGFEAGVIDEIMLNHAPIVLGGGESPFAGLDNLRLKPIEVHASPNATHIVYSTRDLGATAIS